MTVNQLSVSTNMLRQRESPTNSVISRTVYSLAMSRASVLYRTILKLHKSQLSTELKQLGDKYVKEEFRLHKKVTNEAHLNNFYKEWDNYVHIMKNSNGKVGRDLEKTEAQKLNDEQRIKLAELRQETKTV